MLLSLFLDAFMESLHENMKKESSVRRVLARKYRPKFLKDLIGQDLLVQALSRGIIEAHIPQAILLHGIRGTGKTSTARILARALNCVGTDGKGNMTIQPCEKCRSCKALDEDRHPDVLEMDAASHTGVDDIREIIDSTQYRAILGRYKIFIVDEVHMLSKSAFNALLKTLEEPPSHVLFVFATTEINKIPETILSRCARFDLKRVDSKVLIKHFQDISEKEGYTIEQDALAILARSADGSVRDGLTLLDQAMNLTDAEHQTFITSQMVQSMMGATDRRKLYKILEKIFKKQPEAVIEDLRGMINNGEDPLAIIQDLLECLYRVACIKIMPKLSADETIPEFERQASSSIALLTENIQILSLWKKMLKGYEDVKKAPLAQQALEMVLLRICFAATLPSLEEWLNSSDSLSNPDSSALLTQNPIQTKDTNSSPLSHTKSICDIESLLKALEQSKEALLLSYVYSDLAFISFEKGKIVAQAKNQEIRKIIPLLKQFLYQYTGEKWSVELDFSQDSVQSLREQQNEERKEKKHKILQEPFFKSIQEEFPGAVVDFEYNDSLK